MIRVAVLSCACLLALAACHGGTRAVIVRSVAPVVPVCLDGSPAGTPAAARICPVTAASVREVSRRVGASRLRPSERWVSRDMRWTDPAPSTARDLYIERLIGRLSGVWRAPSMEPLSFAPIEELRGSLD